MLVIKNSFISIATHICVCLILLIPFVILYNGISDVILYLTSAIYTVIALLLYFWAGKRFLRCTHKTITNILSVMVIMVILIITILIMYDTQIERLIRLPFTLLGWMISQIFGIENGSDGEKYIFIVLSILPSFAMYLGLMRKESKK